MKTARLRFRYRLSPPASELSHREMAAAWETAAKAAGLPLAYTEGKRPTAQVSLGAPLPQGVTSDAELVDIFFSEAVDPAQALAGLRQHLPAGIEALAAWDVGVNAPSLQSQVRWTEYVVDVPAEGLATGQVEARIEELLQSPAVPAEYRREAKVRLYDLRPLVLDLRLDPCGEGTVRLRMRLRAEPERSGRADQVVLALGLPPPVRVHRTRLAVEEIPAAVLAHRRAGEPGDA